MSIEPRKKQNWNDYSNDSSSISESEPSIIIKNPAIDKLNTIHPNKNFIWLFISCVGLTGPQKNAIKGIKQKSRNYLVFRNEEEEGFDIKVDRDYAIQLLNDGFEKIKNTDIILQQRNFQEKTRKTDTRGSSQRRNYDKGYKRANSQRNKQKVKYVDKQTGEQPTNKKNLFKRQIEQRERKYSRKQAETVGNELGNFRNKPIEKPNQTPEKVYVKREKSPLRKEDDRKSQEKGKMRQLRSAPKKIYVEKEKMMESNRDLGQRRERNRWRQEERDSRSKGKRKMYKEKKENSQQEELFDYFTNTQKYKMKN